MAGVSRQEAGEYRAGTGSRVNSPAIDVYARVQYGAHKIHRARLLLAIGFCAACVFFILLRPAPVILGQKLDPDFYRLLWIIGLVLGIGWTAYDLFFWLRPGKALVELLPEGIIFRVHPHHYIVPWTEVRGVDTVSFTGSTVSFIGRSARRFVRFENVTAVLVSRDFYDRVIYTANWFGRAPFWDNTYRPQGDFVQIVLHEFVLPATSEEIRRQVEARWKTFGKPAANLAPAAVQS